MFQSNGESCSTKAAALDAAAGPWLTDAGHADVETVVARLFSSLTPSRTRPRPPPDPLKPRPENRIHEGRTQRPPPAPAARSCSQGHPA